MRYRQNQRHKRIRESSPAARSRNWR
jgi:hypothetical protein